MKRFFGLGIVCLTFLTSNGQTASFQERAKAYVQKYAAWAMEEQQRVGIPAAITLAQGIHETNAGSSELATQANNHFGIKCKKEWRGATYAYTDDAPNECFRKYPSAKESYVDHSDYLKQSVRYAELFTYDIKNYQAWAKGLKKCGYATNPAYAQKLVKLVEDYGLQEYTLAVLNSQSEVIPMKEARISTAKAVAQEPNTIQDQMINTVAVPKATSSESPNSEVFMIHQLKAFYGKKGEHLLEKALKYNIRYERLLEINELADAPLPRDMVVYLSPKNNKGSRSAYVVKEGETIEQIAQEEGMTSRQLRIFNLLATNEQPVAGSILKLQEQSEERPQTYKVQKANNTNVVNQKFTLQSNQNAEQDPEYLPTKKAVAVNSAATEEIEIGYGAERPAQLNVPKPSIPQQPEREVVQNLEKEPVKEEAQTKTSNEPMDEIALLKARLDKAVYSKSSTSNVKVSELDKAPQQQLAQSQAQKAKAPVLAAQNQELIHHVVDKGDTAFSIAKKYGITIKQLNEWNNLNFEAIKVGQKLRVR